MPSNTTSSAGSNVHPLKVAVSRPRSDREIRDHDDARRALSALLDWAAQESRRRPLNFRAIEELTLSIMDWLEPESPPEHIIGTANVRVSRVVEAQSDISWLFDGEGELAISDVTPDLFQTLLDLRLVTERMYRSL